MTLLTAPSAFTFVPEDPEQCSKIDVAHSPKTLADLKLRLKGDHSKIYATFEPTIRFLEQYRGVEAKLDDLFAELTIVGFRPYLERQTNYATTSLNTHVARFTTLRNHAVEYGYRRYIPVPWQGVYSRDEAKGCFEFVDYFSARVNDPNEVTVEAAEELAKQQAQDGIRGYSEAVNRKNKFLKLLRLCEYTEKQPIATARDDDFGEPVQKMPQPLQGQVEKLLSDMLTGDLTKSVSPDWELQPWDTPTEADLKREEGKGTRRKRTVKQVASAFSLIFGYVKNVIPPKGDDKGYNSMEKLISHDPVWSFRNHALRVRVWTGDAVRNPLASLFAAMKRSKDCDHMKLNWTDELLDGIPRTTQAERDKRKEDHYLTIKELEAIPAKIKAERKKCETRLSEAKAKEQKPDVRRSPYRAQRAKKAICTQKKAIAQLVMAEFIFSFLVVWPLRGSNLRNLRIGGNSPNLFKLSIKRTAVLQIPPEVQKILDDDSGAAVWQVIIPKDEHKTGRITGKMVHVILPSLIVDSLEEFLKYRDDLLADDENNPGQKIDPGTALVSLAGNQLSYTSFARLVKDFAFKYGGAPMNPHLFRDAVGDECMINRPEESEHVAKGLFQSSDKTLKRSYAARHNASCGANKLNEMALARREKTDKEVLAHKSNTRFRTGTNLDDRKEQC